MQIGVPRECMIHEGRVGLIPEAVSELTKRGNQVFVETMAGEKSGFSDQAFIKAGADIVKNAEALYKEAKLIVKVKQPLASDLKYLRKDHLLFSFLHLASDPGLTKQLQAIGLTAIAFETVEEADHSLPLLAPMSDIAGRIAVQAGCHYLHQSMGGKGLLLGGLPAAPRGKVVIIGAGTAGGNAAVVAASLGADVTIFDRKRERLEQMRTLGNNVTALYAYADAIEHAVLQADLLIGAVLITGQKAPHVVSADLVRRMENGSVIVDISVDQGGCIETTKPTNYDNPIFVWEGVQHFCVVNIPGAVPRSSSQALSASLIPYVLQMTGKDWQKSGPLHAGINIMNGEITHPALKAT